MFFNERDYAGLSRATLNAIGTDVSALADTFMKQADAIWDSMAAAKEWRRHGNAYIIRRLNGVEGAAFSRILLFDDRSRNRSRVAVIVARGSEWGPRETLAWAEDSREARVLQAPKKYLAGEFSNQAFQELQGVHCVAMTRHKKGDGEWVAETPLYKYDIRAQMTKYVLDWETPKGSGSASTA